MSRLAEQIEELRPDGVEYRPLVRSLICNVVGEAGEAIC